MSVVPVGPFQKVRSSGTVQGISSPLQLPGNLELYLDARLGTAIYPNHGDSMPTWPDQSGHARNATQIAAGDQPIIIRSGPNVSANGNPFVWFQGSEPAHRTNCGNSLPNPMPDPVAGYTIYAYGRFRPATNALGVSILWQNGAGTGPQVAYEDINGTHHWGWRDTSNTRVGATLFPSSVYGPMAWVFSPPNDGTANGNVYARSGTECQATWHETDFGAQNGYIVGANQVQNGSCNMDLGALLWWSRALSLSELTLLNAYFKGAFG